MSRADPMYREFDDVDLSHWPYVGSAKAGVEMRRLAGLHGLGFVFNPGGGQYVCGRASSPLYGFSCQISTYDDVADLKALRHAVGAALAAWEEGFATSRAVRGWVPK